MLTRYEAIAQASSQMVETDIPKSALPAMVDLALRVKGGNMKRVLFQHGINGYNTTNPNFAMMRALLSDKLPQAEFSVPEGTYLAFVDLRAYCSDEQTLKERISRAGVFVQFGEDFVDNGACFMRVNLASPRSVVREGLERICRALE